MKHSLAMTMTGVDKVNHLALLAPGWKQAEIDNSFVAPRNTLEIHLTKIYEAILNVRPIGIQHDFFDLGGNALVALRLCTQIEKTFGKAIEPANLYQTPTVAQLARKLRRFNSAKPPSSLVEIQSSGTNPPLFCIHPYGGSVLWYYDLAHYLGSDQPFYGLQAQGLDGKRPLHNSISTMAAHYVDEIRTFHPHGPYFLAGYSFGGLVAFEMARQLQSIGIEVALLALLDTDSPGYSKVRADALPSPNRRDCLQQMILRNLNNLKHLKSNDRLLYVWERISNICTGTTSTARRRVKKRISAIAFKCSQTLGLPLPLALRDFKSIHRQILRQYKATYADLTQVYGGRVALLRAIEHPPAINPEPTIGWAKLLSGKLEIHDVPGDHATLIKEPNVQVLAEKLRTCLSEAQALSGYKRTLISTTRTGITPIR
jgi:thioesterase domain-containing protein/acyl carrier protein